jgi:Protein of unknown function (DUF3187)
MQDRAGPSVSGVPPPCPPGVSPHSAATSCYDRRMRKLLAAVLAVLAAGVGLAADPEWRITSVPDPLRSASLPFEAALAEAPPAGKWQISAALAYFNLWQGSWQTVAIHEELQRRGKPIASDELREIERRYPDSDLYRIDLEGTRSELLIARGFSGGLAVTVELPWLEIGRPHWDDIAEWWHHRLGLPNADREVFPRSQTLVYIKTRHGTVEQRDALDGGGLGDASISLAVPLGSTSGGSQRLVLAVEAPTGARDTLRGSGGWDAGVRWFASWAWATRRLRLGAGYTWLAHSGTLLGLRRNDTWHFLAGVDQRLGKGYTAEVAFTWERSPLADVTDSELGKPAAAIRFGLEKELREGRWIAFDMGQDWFATGLSPDYSFQLSAGVRLGR